MADPCVRRRTRIFQKARALTGAAGSVRAVHVTIASSAAPIPPRDRVWLNPRARCQSTLSGSVWQTQPGSVVTTQTRRHGARSSPAVNLSKRGDKRSVEDHRYVERAEVVLDRSARDLSARDLSARDLSRTIDVEFAQGSRDRCRRQTVPIGRTGALAEVRPDANRRPCSACQDPFEPRAQRGGCARRGGAHAGEIGADDGPRRAPPSLGSQLCLRWVTDARCS